MPSFDLHQHLWPESFVAQLARRTAPPFLKNGRLVLREGRSPLAPNVADAVARVRGLDRDGLDVGVISLQPTLGTQDLPEEERIALEETWIDGVPELLGLGGGRLRAFAPGRCLEGFVGASVPAATLLDFEASAPLLDELERRSQVLFVHPGPAPKPPSRAPKWWSGVVDYPAQMHAAYFSWLGPGRRRWPELRVLFAILAGGAPFQLERRAQRGSDVRSTLDANVFFDVATYGRRAIELCIETFGVGQLVYGSDTPVVNAAPTLRAVRGFGESVAQLVTTDNPTRLLS